MNTKIRLLRLPAVIETTGLSKSTIYLMISQGRFPKSYKIGKRACAWIEDELQSWLNLQLEKENARTQTLQDAYLNDI